MSFNLDEMIADEPYWEKFVEKFGSRLIAQGWEGPLDTRGLEKENNWDTLDDLLNMNMSELASEEAFEESDGGGIPGSADFATIWNLEGSSS